MKTARVWLAAALAALMGVIPVAQALLVTTLTRSGGLNAGKIFEAPLLTSLTPTVAAGSSTPTFTRATTATVLAFRSSDTASTGPVVVNIASGEARFYGARHLAQDSWAATYNDGTAIASSVLLGFLAEQASTNLALQSANFGTTWVAVGTPTRSAAADTCGDLNLDLIGDDDGAVLEGYTQVLTFTGNATKAVSIFVKAGTSTSTVIRLRDTTGLADRLLVTLAWSGGVPTPTTTTGSILGTDTLGNSVYRVRMLTTSVTAANTNQLEVYPASSSALITTSTGNVFAGGVQAENSAYATTYIPTTTATVTRNLDVLTYPTAGNTSNVTGTAYAEATIFTPSGNTQGIVAGGNSSVNNNPILKNNTNKVTIFDSVGNNAATTGTMTDNVTHKYAGKWGTSLLAAALDGVVTSAGTYSGTIWNQLGIGGLQGGSSTANGAIRNVKIWNRALADQEIRAL